MNEHRSRFKAYLIDPSGLVPESEKLRPSLEEFQKAFARGEITAAEWATLFVFLYLNERSGEPWWMKKSSLQKLGGDFFLAHWLSEFQIKKLPDSVSRTLYCWMQGRYPIELKQTFISPYEMLEHQARGTRVVTLSQESAVSGTLVDGTRDALEFLLHDLVHADLFFSSAQKLAEQKSFFASLLALLEKGWLQDEQKADPQFQRDFNYLISDMNSHPAHLASMLKASYIKHLLFIEGKGDKGVLSRESQGVLNERLESWQSAGRFEFSLTNI